MLNRNILPVNLFLIFAWSMRAQPAPGGPADLDHFNCYLAHTTVQPRLVWLQDQFDVSGKFETAQDIRLAFFCNPVQKVYKNVTTKILHGDAHLAMYQLSTQPGVPRIVTLQNQFGVQTIHTGPAVVLAVPSGKAHIVSSVPPQLPPIPKAGELDHFKCYAASGQALNAAVVLTDQFHTEKDVVLQPYLFCNPVTKMVPSAPPCTPFAPCATTTPIVHPQSHLMCYIKTPGAFQGVVVYNNQFVAPSALPTVSLTNSELLCAPSFKLSWSEVKGTSTEGN